MKMATTADTNMLGVPSEGYGFSNNAGSLDLRALRKTPALGCRPMRKSYTYSLREAAPWIDVNF